MHMKYKVTLPGPNYAIATQHKLILSVISDIRVREKVNGGAVTCFAVTYSSPGYCTIQSEKYRGSSAYYHLQDMKRIQSLYIFDDSFSNVTGESKPVMILTVDGVLSENPRHMKTIECVIDYFASQDLDTSFLATNTIRRRAFNRIECKMVGFIR